MRGIELPVNVIVVILVAVIVLLTVVSLYFAGWIPGAQSIDINNVKNDACRRLSTNCYGQVNQVTLKSFDADKDGKLDPGYGIGNCSNTTEGATAQDNLYMLCKCYYNADEDQCRDVCGCKGIAPVSQNYPPEVP